MPGTSPPASPFDAVAAEYDARFTETPLGRWLRAAVRERLDRSLGVGDHVLELGCGTGEDAVWLAERGVRVTATDASAAMLATTRRKVEAAGARRRISVAHFDFAADPLTYPGIGAEGEGVESFLTEVPFDGAFSNFGGLNCVPDRRPLAEVLAGWLRPGACLLLVLMGRVCPWEVIWHLALGRPGRALRRFRAGRPAMLGGDATVRVWYPPSRRLRDEFRPWFHHVETVGIGVLLPPTDLGRLVERWPRTLTKLRDLDRLVAPRLPWLGDHYLARFERR